MSAEHARSASECLAAVEARYSAISEAVPGAPGTRTRLANALALGAPGVTVATVVPADADGATWANRARRVPPFWGSRHRDGLRASINAIGLSFGNKSG